MPATHQLGFHLVEFRPHPRSHRLSPEHETSSPGLSTNVGKTQEVERFRLAEPPLPTAYGRISTKLHQARLLVIQLQAELRKSITKLSPEPLRIITVLKANHDVISKTNDDHITARFLATPLVSP